MASVKSNADEYINKLYDKAHDSQKQQLMDAYSSVGNVIDTQQQNTQQQAQNYTERANTEVQKVAQSYKPANLSGSANAQVALATQNQQKNNVAAINNQQQVANAEYERLRKLYADQYSAAIKQAQADNDMARAQQLYEAAKAKEEELLAFTNQMGTLNNEALINKIYDSATESKRQELAQQELEALSNLYAQQTAQQRQTDQSLNNAYVDALRNSKNYNEVQNAYGLGSGSKAQAQLARELGTAKNLTELRRLQMASDAQTGANIASTQKSYADTLSEAVKANEQARAQAKYREALTQIPEVEETSYGGRGYSQEPPPAQPSGNYETILNDITNAKANGYYGGETQSMINAAYKEGLITAAEKKELEKHRNGLIYAG